MFLGSRRWGQLVYFCGGGGDGDGGDGGGVVFGPRLGRGICWIHLVSGVGVASVGRGGSGCRCRDVLETSLGRSPPQQVVSWAISTSSESSFEHHGCLLHDARSSPLGRRRIQLSKLHLARLCGRAAYLRPAWPPPATPHTLDGLLCMRFQMIFAVATCTKGSIE